MNSEKDNSNSEQLPVQLFRDIVDSTPNPVVIFEPCGNRRYANDSAQLLFGHFKCIFDLIENAHFIESLQHQINSSTAKPAAAAASDLAPSNLEVEIKCCDQQRRCFELKWKRINDNSTYLIAIFRNVDSEKQRQQELYQQAATDFLSGLPNRRQFRAILDSQAGQDVCLAILDVDHFKQINDCHGHMVGDRAIRFVAHQLMDCFEDALCVSRLGGDEFCVLIRQTKGLNATERFEEFRQRIEESKLTKDENGLTVSIGVANSFPDWNWHELMTRADQALYRAKENGRNQVFACQKQ